MAMFFAQALAKGNPLLGDISKAMLNVTGGDTMVQIEKKWMGYQNDCQNVGPVTGSSSLTFANFGGLFILTGAASTSSLFIALIIYAYKKQHRSTKLMENENEQEGKSRTDDENKEHQEKNQGAATEECVQFRGDGEENRRLHEQTGSEQVCDGNPHTSTAAWDGSAAIHRGEPSTVLQTESI
jgi:ionotropic glutamate receptor